MAGLASVLKRLAQLRRPYRVVDDAELEALASSPHHEGIVVEAPPVAPPHRWGRGTGQWLLLDGVQNPHNVGAILRSAAHFGVRGIWAIDGPRIGGAAARVAEGGAEYVPYAPVPLERALEGLQAAGSVVGTTGGRAPSLFEVPMTPCRVWVLGSEHHGIRPEVAALVGGWVQVAGTGHVESLNVSVSAALVCAEYARRPPLVRAERTRAPGGRSQGRRGPRKPR